MNILDQIVLEKKNFIKYLKQKELNAIKIPKKHGQNLLETLQSQPKYD